jgi:phosphate transport system permease protein
MRLETRRLLDRAFSSLGLIAIGLMALVLIVILTPIISKGTGAFVFRSTVEHRKLMFDHWSRGNPDKVKRDEEAAAAARAPVYQMLTDFKAELDAMPRAARTPYKKPFRDVQEALSSLLGPEPGSRTPVLIRQQYGATRWDRKQVKLQNMLYSEEWDYSKPGQLGVKVLRPRADDFRGTKLEPLFAYVKDNINPMMRPRWTCYWQFLFDTSKDSHIFGGIGPEVLGTIYLTLGAMFFAVPMGVIAAIYLCEYARAGRIISLLRICISTLAGVPSIVFGLFGLAFFLNTIHISDSKSVLAGSLTLALLILPTVVRASEEAILAVPHTYKEAALSLGAGRWHTIMTVILPAALPGILTGTVISMGRAAGETAPIIFTAAVSVGRPLLPLQALSQPTPALPWNIYNLCTEHEAVDEIRHVQYGMVFTLVALVLLLNIFAIVMRARISKKLRG